MGEAMNDHRTRNRWTHPSWRDSLDTGSANWCFRIAWHKPFELKDVEAGPFAARNDRGLPILAVTHLDAGIELLHAPRASKHRVAEITGNETDGLRVHAAVCIGSRVEPL